MIALLDYVDIVKRLNRMVPELHNNCGDAFAFANAIENNTFHDVGSYVVMGTDRAGENSANNAIIQRNVVSFPVLLAIRQFNTHGGESAKLQTLRKLIMGALVGYKPEQHGGAISYHSGRIYGFKHGAIWWADTYRVSLPIRS